MHEKPALVRLGCRNYIPKTADERKICIKSLNVYGAIFNEKCESASFDIKKHSETNFVVFLFLLKQFRNGNIDYSNGIQ